MPPSPPPPPVTAPGTAPGLQLELKERDIRITESNQQHLLVSSQEEARCGRRVRGAGGRDVGAYDDGVQ